MDGLSIFNIFIKIKSVEILLVTSGLISSSTDEEVTNSSKLYYLAVRSLVAFTPQLKMAVHKT